MKMTMTTRNKRGVMDGGGALMLLLLLLLVVQTAQAFTPVAATDHYYHCGSSSSSSPATTSPLFRRFYGPHPPASLLMDDDDDDAITFAATTTTTTTNHADTAVQALMIRQSLGEYYPRGFCRALAEGAAVHVKRYWILDDSYSMSTADGHFLLTTEQKLSHAERQQQQEQQSSSSSSSSMATKTTTTTTTRTIIECAPCTRWNELQETCLQHAILAQHLQIPTDFRLLNDATGHFRINPPGHNFAGGRGRGRGRKTSNSSSNNVINPADLQHAQKILTRAKPKGVTPLTPCLERIHQEIKQSILPKLDVGQKVAIVVATDGLPTSSKNNSGSGKSTITSRHCSPKDDPQLGLSTLQAKEDFRRALQSLPLAQTSVVIRLCTDDAAVVEYYHALEAELPHVHVVDDYWAEAARVQQHNPWLNYGLALHRVREMSYCTINNMPMLKALSQRPLSAREMLGFLQFLFAWPLLARPMTWNELSMAVHKSNAREELVWNPVQSQLAPWINVDELEKAWKK